MLQFRIRWFLTILTLYFPPLFAQSIFDLPQVPQEQPSRWGTSLSAAANIVVKQFKFEGNTIFSDEVLAKIVLPFCGIKISAEQLQELKTKITNFYIKNGYINSGAIIPDQQVKDGVVVLKIIEGKVSQIEVSGNKSLHSDYFQNRLQFRDSLGNPKAVLNINELQERLQVLHQNPLIKRIHAELSPGINLGDGILKIDVYEDVPYLLKFNFNNYRSPSVGAYRGELVGLHRNLSGLLTNKGWGDSLYLRYGLTEGLNDYTLKYDIPINYHNSVSFKIERSDSEIIESPFNKLNIESDVKTYALSLSHSFIRHKKNKSLDVSLKLEKRISLTFLFGRPFSFSSGVNSGKSDITVLRFSQDWLDRSIKHVIAARSSFNFGVDAFGSTVNNDGSPDSKFVSWIGQFQYVRRLDFLSNNFLKNSHIIFRTDIQKADQKLLALEKISIGGFSSVRGYRENLLSRDNGLISSLEWRVPIKRKKILLELASFIDYGYAWNREDDSNYIKDIYSVGLGLRWDIGKYFHSQLYWGYALRDIPVPNDKNLQDNGVHFEMSLRF